MNQTGADIVTGTRYRNENSGVSGWPAFRHLTSSSANFLATLMLETSCTDLTGSFRYSKFIQALQEIGLRGDSAEHRQQRIRFPDGNNAASHKRGLQGRRSSYRLCGENLRRVKVHFQRSKGVPPRHLEPHVAVLKLWRSFV